MGRDIFTTRAGPIEIGNRRQLFLDDYCVAELSGVRRRMHRPVKHGPLMLPDSARGQCALQARNVPQWNPEKRLWEWWYWGSWTCEPYGPWHSTSLALMHDSVSADGLAWEKPSLGLYEWQGSKDNNIAFDPATGNRGIDHVIRDEAEPLASRRYKGLLNLNGRTPAVSPDGFAWTALGDAAFASSDESHFCYDESSGQYVALVKRGTVWGRSIWLVTSRDFEHWEDHGCVMHADQVDWDNRMPRIRAVAEDPRYLSPPLIDEADYIAETYQMACLPYQGIYVGLVGIFNPAGAIPPPQTNFTGINQTELAMIRDLKRWRRVGDREVYEFHSEDCTVIVDQHYYDREKSAEVRQYRHHELVREQSIYKKSEWARTDGFLGQLECFMGALLRGGRACPSIEDCVRTIELTEAVQHGLPWPAAGG